MSLRGNLNPKEDWSYRGGSDPNIVRKIMSNFSIYIRMQQYKYFLKLLKPKASDKILDVGTSKDETLPDTNFFEKNYPYNNKLSIASIENSRKLVEKYHLAEFIKVKPSAKLPIKDKNFDIVVSWATIEHVGDWEKQEFFLKEIIRIGKKIFITTPDKLSFYEPHTATFFLHFLPPAFFRKILKFIGKDFWSKEENLNILSIKSVKKMTYSTNVRVESFKLYGIFPSHIIIYGETT